MRRRASLGMVFMLLGTVLLFQRAATLPGATVSGQARVIDADTLEIADRRVRILGVDAPEADQKCHSAAGQGWRCGAQAKLALATLVRSHTVSCRIAGRDRCNRDLGQCGLASTDLGDWLVRHGWAIPYGEGQGVYEEARREAEAAGGDLWIGAFDPPSEWRRTHAPTRHFQNQRTP